MPFERYEKPPELPLELPPELQTPLSNAPFRTSSSELPLQPSSDANNPFHIIQYPLDLGTWDLVGLITWAQNDRF